MTISYNWLSNYLPEKIEPERLSRILTSVGLEVESMEKYERIKGGLEGLVVGEVLDCQPHPNADKLTLTKVNTGGIVPLHIVCGAPNVAVGQKVIVAPVGATIYPVKGTPVTMKLAKIRGEESQGMICAEDEIGLGESHAGIIVLPADTAIGVAAAAIFEPYSDIIYEIGLTPNHMDAMSHIGTARDVCAYLQHHNNHPVKVKLPFVNAFKADNNSLPVAVEIKDKAACKRYSGITISNVTVGPSPAWLQNSLLAIGQKPINNIVDITNYVLHETGQPLHAFDADAIMGKKIIVQKLAEGTAFTTLDGKERKLGAQDLMICNAEEPMCIAGVFGGMKSGVSSDTKNIFLESAWFDPVHIRKTFLYHDLRTEAASRFEKNVDISSTVTVLKRAALLIKEIAGGEISSDIVDEYPVPAEKTQVEIKYHYLKKISGKNYHPDAVKKILESLGFELIKEGIDALRVAAPLSKPDISLPADVAEEVLRIDGIDNIEIPSTISISPALDDHIIKEQLLEKMAGYLTGSGFNEILTNSITNSRYYTEETLHTAVKMINSLSAELDVLRPSMLETGLESIVYNINRKQANLKFFEFGKTYAQKAVGSYTETEHLSLFSTGNNHADGWQEKAKPVDFFALKGVVQALLVLCGIGDVQFVPETTADSDGTMFLIKKKSTVLGSISKVPAAKLAQFDIKQPVYFADLFYGALLGLYLKQQLVYTEIPKYPAVQRDLAIITDKKVSFAEVEQSIRKAGVHKLQQYRLFDIFESDKLGSGKKSMALNFVFLDPEKTLTDKETDGMMQRIVQQLENEVAAEIRK